MNASSPMFCLVYEGNYEVIALRLLQRRLHLVALYWHPTISLSISFQLKRPTRPIEECSSLPTACICKLSFLIAFAFGNIFYRMQSLFAWCVSITRRTYILWLDLRAIARLLLLFHRFMVFQHADGDQRGSTCGSGGGITSFL